MLGIELRSDSYVKIYVEAADDNDSYKMYTAAKATHTRVTSFSVAQHSFENLFNIKLTSTFAAFSDALSDERLTFDGIFDPTSTGTMSIDNIWTMMLVNGLPERFRYMKDCDTVRMICILASSNAFFLFSSVLSLYAEQCRLL